MTDDQWQAAVTHDAAQAIAAWLEARGRLERPIHSLTMPDLEAMASAAICRFVVMGSERIKTRPDDEGLTRILLV